MVRLTKKYNTSTASKSVRNDDILILSQCLRSFSHRRCSVKKGALRNFAKLTGKHLCQSLFFNKIGLQLYLKRRLWHRCFPVNFQEHLFLKNTGCFRPKLKSLGRANLTKIFRDTLETKRWNLFSNSEHWNISYIKNQPKLNVTIFMKYGGYFSSVTFEIK